MIASLVATLTGCGGGSSPILDRGNTIAGTDANADGIRDDINDYINNNYSAGPRRKAAIQSAKALQKALLTDKTDILVVKEVNRGIARADTCIFAQFDGKNNSKNPWRVSIEMEEMTTNTKKRLLAYHAFNKALSGTSWTMPSGNSCE